MLNETNKCSNCAERTSKEILIQALITEKEEIIINERNIQFKLKEVQAKKYEIESLLNPINPKIIDYRNKLKEHKINIENYHGGSLIGKMCPRFLYIFLTALFLSIHMQLATF